MEVKKDWGEHFFIKLATQYTNSITQLPNALQNCENQNVSNIHTLFLHRLSINKHSNLLLKTEWFNQNLNSPNKASFLFTDWVVIYFTQLKSSLY